jgi:hypothetical protein
MRDLKRKLELVTQEPVAENVPTQEKPLNQLNET